MKYYAIIFACIVACSQDHETPSEAVNEDRRDNERVVDAVIDTKEEDTASADSNIGDLSSTSSLGAEPSQQIDSKLEETQDFKEENAFSEGHSAAKESLAETEASALEQDAARKADSPSSSPSIFLTTAVASLVGGGLWRKGCLSSLWGPKKPLDGGGGVEKGKGDGTKAEETDTEADKINTDKINTDETNDDETNDDETDEDKTDEDKTDEDKTDEDKTDNEETNNDDINNEEKKTDEIDDDETESDSVKFDESEAFSTEKKKKVDELNEIYSALKGLLKEDGSSDASIKVTWMGYLAPELKGRINKENAVLILEITLSNNEKTSLNYDRFVVSDNEKSASKNFFEEYKLGEIPVVKNMLHMFGGGLDMMSQIEAKGEYIESLRKNMLDKIRAVIDKKSDCAIKTMITQARMEDLEEYSWIREAGGKS